MLRDILKGLSAGQVQIVGNMSVIPLTGQSVSDNLETPDQVTLAQDTNYGSLHLRCHSGTTIVPAGYTYITKERAQDRTVPSAHILKGTKEFPAFCVQSSQCGFMGRDKDELREFRLLPHSLRYHAYKDRNVGRFNTLWGYLRQFNTKVRVDGDFLVSFFTKYAEQLEQFVAEFEPIPEQRGAIILVNDEVVGIEVLPSEDAFLKLWRQIIRDCYGAYALTVRDSAKPNKSTVLGGVSGQGFCKDVRCLADLLSAVENLEENERKAVKDVVDNILKENERTTRREAVDNFSLFDLESGYFVGQIVTDKSDTTVYASLMAKPITNREFSW